MELLNQIFATIFYILFFSWILFLIRNIVLTKKMNSKEFYKSIKKDLKQQKVPKNLNKTIKISMIIFVIYLVIGLVSGILALFMMFITLGGIAYVDTGSNSTFYDNLMTFVGNHFSLLKYIIFYIYFIVYIILIKAIYINIVSYRKLKSNDLSQQNISDEANPSNTQK